MNKIIKFVLNERGVHFLAFTLAASIAGLVNFGIGIYRGRTDMIVVGSVVAIIFGFLSLINAYCVKEDWDLQKEVA